MWPNLIITNYLSFCYFITTFFIITINNLTLLVYPVNIASSCFSIYFISRFVFSNHCIISIYIKMCVRVYIYISIMTIIKKKKKIDEFLKKFEPEDMDCLGDWAWLPPYPDRCFAFYLVSRLKKSATVRADKRRRRRRQWRSRSTESSTRHCRSRFPLDGTCLR